jgi:spermidine synthase
VTSAAPGHDVLVQYDEVARSASERGEVVLRRRHDPDDPHSPGVLELRVNGVFVMDTQECTTEVELARAALAEVTAPRRVLVGGLGLGYTAHEVLADHRVELLVVAELEDALVQWFRDGTIARVSPGPHLADQRLHLACAAVQQVVAEARDAAYDLVLLDVDNGPDFLVHEDNAAIYEPPFLHDVRRVLAPGGVAAVWSASRATALEEALEAVFGNARAVRLPVTLQGRDEAYWLHLAGRDGP